MISRRHITWFVIPTILAVLVFSCPPRFNCGTTATKRSLKGQSNTEMTFYGQCIDQDGNPLPGVMIEIDNETIPKNWSFDTRGDPHLHSTIRTTSGPDGRFRVDVVTHILRVK